ncbi:hypothetical protein [Pseudoclavibacter sp. CFCC 13611]|uniref:hypothetical protein n=1 Tax=Pseudoclavibacter sp. CFCC 13611 TaxID=2615178 RepID=UPI00130147EE|nr:hypothetical protein [Pseudoclavibacter sp. CFCC 13611]KAB1662925.1 hypothetical protein F8O08_10250 [Pseudoclavibacter sp. CFCC 13611]
MLRTWTAPDGSVWPLTGYWCPQCSMPMAEAAATSLGVHPCCMPDYLQHTENHIAQEVQHV